MSDQLGPIGAAISLADGFTSSSTVVVWLGSESRSLS